MPGERVFGGCSRGARRTVAAAARRWRRRQAPCTKRAGAGAGARLWPAAPPSARATGWPAWGGTPPAARHSVGAAAGAMCWKGEQPARPQPCTRRFAASARRGPCMPPKERAAAELPSPQLRMPPPTHRQLTQTQARPRTCPRWISSRNGSSRRAASLHSSALAATSGAAAAPPTAAARAVAMLRLDPPSGSRPQSQHTSAAPPEMAAAASAHSPSLCHAGCSSSMLLSSSSSPSPTPASRLRSRCPAAR